MAVSQVRQNFHTESEEKINKQINQELYASYVYLSMVSYPEFVIVTWYKYRYIYYNAVIMNFTVNERPEDLLALLKFRNTIMIVLFLTHLFCSE